MWIIWTISRAPKTVLFNRCAYKRIYNSNCWHLKCTFHLYVLCGREYSWQTVIWHRTLLASNSLNPLYHHIEKTHESNNTLVWNTPGSMSVAVYTCVCVCVRVTTHTIFRSFFFTDCPPPSSSTTLLVKGGVNLSGSKCCVSLCLLPDDGCGGHYISPFTERETEREWSHGAAVKKRRERCQKWAITSLPCNSATREGNGRSTPEQNPAD